MNPITWQLVKKDWYFNRLPMLGYFVLGALALALVSMATTASFYVGSTLLITVVVVIGIHMVFSSVVHERSRQVLPMIMSLPITFVQFTRAKLIANIGVFGLAWLAIVAALFVIISSNDALANGLLPFSLIMLGELFVANTLILAVAMITESEAWTIVVMAFCNLCISLFIFFVGGSEAIGKHMEGPVAVWNSAAIGALLIEALAIALLVALTFYVQSRKNDYL